MRAESAATPTSAPSNNILSPRTLEEKEKAEAEGKGMCLKSHAVLIFYLRSAAYYSF